MWKTKRNAAARSGIGILAGLSLILGASALSVACGDSSAGSTGTTGESDTTGEGTTDEATSTTTGGMTSTTAGGPGTDSVGETSGTTTEDPSTTVGTTDEPMTSSTTTEPEGVCGDGVVDDGEECDLGPDNDDAGVCTSMCMDAFCGDGLLGPGEGCDDGNDVNDDECSNECTSPGCGDGVVQDPEECDDGNDVDTDACLATCVNATCGDGFVQDGVEGCDDGNADNDDECTTLCAAPACDDGILSGAESDVDCGGDTCEGCGLGGACVGSGDCGEGVCVDNSCALAASCKELHEADPQAASGVYQIDPDGEGGEDPFEAYCEMEANDGGWTLVLKADGRNATFAYSAALWTDNVLHTPAEVDFDHTEAKLAGWNVLAFDEVMVGIEYMIDDNQNPPTMNYVVLPTASTSMFDLMSPNTPTMTNIGRDAWKGIIAGGSLQPNCNLEGFNIQPNPNPGHHSVRIGIVGNNEGDCNTTDSRIGIGGVGTACGTLADPVGNFAGCGGDEGNKNLTAYGAVFVR